MLLQALRRQEQALRRLGQGRRSWGLAQRIPGRGRRSCRQQGLRIRHRQLTRRSFPGEGWRGWRLKEKEHVMSVLGGWGSAALLVVRFKADQPGSTGRPWTGRLPPMLASWASHLSERRPCPAAARLSGQSW